MTRAPLIALMVLLVVALIGPWLTADPLATDVEAMLAPPSRAHWFGTDHLGRDILARVVAAARFDLTIAGAAVVLAAAAGTVIGAAAGQRGGWPDALAGRLAEGLMAFPLFVLALVMVTALGNSVRSVVLATVLVNLPFYLRLARAEARVLRHAGFVEAARAGGAGGGRILRRAIIPNILPLVAVQGSVNLGWAVMNVAALSFLGLGIRPPQPEWGVMVAEGARFLATGEWWVAAFPGAALAGTILCFNLAGDGLRDRLADPGR